MQYWSKNLYCAGNNSCYLKVAILCRVPLTLQVVYMLVSRHPDNLKFTVDSALNLNSSSAPDTVTMRLSQTTFKTDVHAATDYLTWRLLQIHNLYLNHHYLKSQSLQQTDPASDSSSLVNTFANSETVNNPLAAWPADPKTCASHSSSTTFNLSNCRLDKQAQFLHKYIVFS